MLTLWMLKRRGLTVRMCAVVFVIVFSSRAAAQTSIEFQVGVRGGLLDGGNAFEVFSNHYYPPAYSTEDKPYSFGPTVGVLIDDRYQIRFEAVRTLFRFHGESTTPFPQSLSKTTSTTDGELWQYPLLVTVQSKSGPARPFFGGGISVGRSVKGKASSVVMNVNPATGAITTTFSTESYRDRSSPLAFYVTGGLDGRLSIFSIRPEVRFGHWTVSKSDQENKILSSNNQFEFLVGITLRPFRFNAR